MANLIESTGRQLLKDLYSDMEENPRPVKKPNPHEALARQRKAFALAAHLHKHGITADVAEFYDFDQWVQIAKDADTNEPGRDGQTIREAIEALRTLEPRPKLSPEEVKRLFRRCAS